jgi:hypothetical protein
LDFNFANSFDIWYKRFWTRPYKGYYFEIANEYSSKYIGSQYNFNKLFFKHEHIISCHLEKDCKLEDLELVIFWFKRAVFWIPRPMESRRKYQSLGGKQSLRGYRANRFLARSLWFYNIE